jgi:hypothetical protein
MTTTRKASAAKATAIAVNRDWRIDNESTTTDLVVLQCTTTEVIPSKFYYGQTLASILPSPTDHTIPAGMVSSIIVPAETQDSDGNPQDMTFILANAKTLFPVKLVSFATGTADFDNTTVTDTDVLDMGQAFNFWKNIVCFPGTALATDFTNALLNEDPETAVDAFFKNTDNYKTVTLDMYQAVTSYHTYLPYGWADNGKNKTYWVYKGDSAEVTPIGKLEISNKWNVPLDVVPTDDFKATLTISGLAEKALTFNEGLFSAKTNDGATSIALKGSFILRSRLTENIIDEDLASYLIGAINMVGAFALDYEYKNEDNEDGGFYQITHPGNFKEGLDLFVYITAVGMGIGFLVDLTKLGIWIKNRKLPNESDRARKQQFDDLEGLIKSRTDYLLAQLANGAHFPTPEQLKTAQSDARTRQLNEKARESKTRLNEVIGRQQRVLDTLSNYGVTTSLEHAGAELLRLTDIQALPTEQYLKNLQVTIDSMKDIQDILSTQKRMTDHRIDGNQKIEIEAALTENTGAIRLFDKDITDSKNIDDSFEFEHIES